MKTNTYGHNLSARIEEKHAEMLRRLAHARGESISTMVRRAVLRELMRYGKLDDEHVRALTEKEGGDA